MMYHPGKLDVETWGKYTKAFVDWKVKDEDEEGDHGTAYSVDNVYNILKNPGGNLGIFNNSKIEINGF